MNSDEASLRGAIRTLQAVGEASRPSAMEVPDGRALMRAIETIAKAIEKAWPFFSKWFVSGLSEAEMSRFRELTARLPSSSEAEVRELLALTRKGLRLDRQSAEATEDELPGDELDSTPG